MINFDFHVHTQFSYDSRIEGKHLLQKAVQLGYNEIAITEHLDLLPEELSIFGLPSLKQYQSYCMNLQNSFPGIKLRMGIEIGDYHRVRSFAKALISDYEFCPILGSVHFLSDRTNVAVPLTNKLSKAQVEDYYRQNLKLVESCDIDILAHLGVYKRYYSDIVDETLVSGLIDEILSTIIARNIALEINLSGLRKPYARILPEEKLIERYRNLGGKLISIGSDSHHIDHFNQVPEFVRELCRGFQPPLFCR